MDEPPAKLYLSTQQHRRTTQMTTCINAQGQLDTLDGKFSRYQVVLPTNTNLDILLDRQTGEGEPLHKGSCCTAWRPECSAELEIVSHNSNSCFPVEILTTSFKADGLFSDRNFCDRARP